MSQQHEYFGKYILLEKLGTGGMAEIFLARAPGAGGIGKFVAIKRILPQYSDNQEFVEMFKREAKIAVNLSHSNIVSIYEFGVQNSQFFLVMDYVEGRNLRQILNKLKSANQHLGVDQVVFMIKEVAAGLDHAHRCLDGSTGKPLNITHRDISPQNVMISFEGEVRIVDFGIAKDETQMEATRAGTIKGKFGYMSPEQAEGQMVDLRTDIFSLGIVLWEMLASDRLFIANNEVNTLRKIRDCQVPPLKKFNPNIHPELERIVMKTLSKDRNLRYQTAAALHRDLSRYLNRQFPDFSSHDFSVFIKTLFADDILKTRKRLVDYSKIPMKEQRDTSHDVAVSEYTITESTKTFPTFNPQKADEVSVSSGPNGLLKEDLTADPNKTIVGGDTNSSASVDLSNNTMSDIRAERKRERARVLDSSVIEKLESEQLKVEERFKGEPVRQVDKRPLHRRLPMAQNQGSRAGANIAQLAVGLFLIMGTFILSNKLFTKQMEPISQLVCPNIDAFYTCDRYVDNSSHAVKQTDKGVPKAAPSKTDNTATDVDKSTLKITTTPPGASIFVNNQLLSETSPTEIPIQPDEVFDIRVELEGYETYEMQQITADTIGFHLQTQLDEISFAPIIVQSQPSGAQIFVNGRPTGQTTPSAIQPPTETFDLTLKRDGFIDYKIESVRRDEVGPKLRATLQEASVAFIDIDVIPPRGSRVYVNGKLLEGERLPIRGYSIPSDRPVVIRAENPYKRLVGEKTITLRKGIRKWVTVNLNRKGTRLPTSEKESKDNE